MPALMERRAGSSEADGSSSVPTGPFSPATSIASLAPHPRAAATPCALLASRSSPTSVVLFRSSKLIMPAPQMSEEELETIQRSTLGAGTVGAAAAQALATGSSATKALLGQFAGGQTPALGGATPFAGGRTPLAARTPMQKDTVLMEAQNLIALTTSRTPLAGGENTPLHVTDFSSVTPKRPVAQVLYTQPSHHSLARLLFSCTPDSSAQAGRRSRELFAVRSASEGMTFRYCRVFVALPHTCALCVRAPIDARATVRCRCKPPQTSVLAGQLAERWRSLRGAVVARAACPSRGGAPHGMRERAGVYGRRVEPLHA